MTVPLSPEHHVERIKAASMLLSPSARGLVRESLNALLDLLADAEQREAALAEGLHWIAEFASKMADRHTGFVHVERRARGALAAVPDVRPSSTDSPFEMPRMSTPGGKPPAPEPTQ